jgi:hypothetical protein
MRVSRLSVIAVTGLVASLLTPAAPALAATPAVAVITSPTEGGVVGVPALTVTAEGHLDPTGTDNVGSLLLTVDGDVPSGQVLDCTAGQPTAFDCSGSFQVDTSTWGEASSPHTLRIDLFTTATIDIASSTVNVVGPSAPSVAFSPVPGQLVGPASIGVVGNTDPVSNDTPASVTLDWGTTTIGTQLCPAQPSCPLTFSYDTTGLNESHDLVATMTTMKGLQADVIQAAVDARNPAPTVTIDSPDAGAPEKGIVAVSAHGGVEGHQTDFAQKMELFVGSGTTPVSTVNCDTSARDCSTTALTWDATGRADGNYTLKVVFTSTRGRTGNDSVQVKVTSPPPTVSIASPAEGATGSGVVTVNATGTVDASQVDYGKSMQLFVNNTPEDTITCPVTKSCPATLTWDGTGVNGTRTLKVVFTTHAGESASDSRNVLMTTTPPVAVITTPGNAATVSGPISVVATGTVNSAQKDTPGSMQLLIDGAAVSAAQPCTGTAAAPRVCSLAFTWDTTGLSGAHSLQAKFLTQKGFGALSPVNTINVRSPAPTAVILAPATRATVHRTAVITVSGAIDPSQTDSPASMRLTLDGAALGGVIPCAPTATAPRVCSAAYTWNTVGLTGRHTLVATVVSAKGAVGSSAATSVFVYGGTRTVLTPAKATRAGRSVTYTGRVTTLINKLGVPGVKVKVLITPAKGKAKTLFVRTNVHGFFKVAFKPAVNTTVVATLVTLPYYGVSHTSTKLHVVPSIKCSVGSSVARNRLDRGSCRVTNLPKNTKVTLQYEFLGRWYTLGAGKAPGAVIPFSFRFTQRGTYHVRVVLSATSVFAGATGPALKVAVT